MGLQSATLSLSDSKGMAYLLDAIGFRISKPL
jgi:hypothetical protein